MDGDGDLDIVAGRGGEQNVVYLNDGRGNFPSAGGRPFGTGADQTRSVAVGDVDGDGDLDIATGNDGQQNVVYLNDGRGNFPSASGRPFGTGADQTRSVVVGDVDGDGDLDIATGNYVEQNIVYLNDGRGNFPSSSGRPFGTGTARTSSIAIGDVDGDGHLDLIAGHGEYFSAVGGQDAVYLNDGRGNFPSERLFGTGMGNTLSVVVGDVDSDKDLDIVVGTAPVFDPSCNCEVGGEDIVYLNDGRGNFPSASRRPFGPVEGVTQGIGLGDVDSDGDIDIVTGLLDQDAVYLNDGTGQFPASSAVSFGTGRDATTSVALADVDGDGALDLISSNIYQQDVVYLNNRAGRFPVRDERPVGTQPDFSISTALGDIDGDGDLDIIMGNAPILDEGCGCYTGGQDIVYLNDGKGNFPTSNARPFGTGIDSALAVAVGDVDGDGDLDIATANDREQSIVYLNDGRGNFPSASGRPFGTGVDSTAAVAFGDMDHDGDLDIITGNTPAFDSSCNCEVGGQDIVYLNDGRGNFPSANGRPFGTGIDSTLAIAIGDVDGDSDLDIISGNRFEQDKVYLNDGASNFPTATARPFGTGVDNTFALAVGDVDGDSDLDIATGNFGQQNFVYLNDGTGNFPFDSKRLFGSGGDRTSSIAMGDFDSDGDLDLVTGNGSYSEGEQNVVYLNDAAGNFPTESRRLFGSEGSWTGRVAVGDVDSDGDLDIISANIGQQSMIYINRWADPDRLPNNPPTVFITRPGAVGNADFFSTPQIITDTLIPIKYVLADREGDSIRSIKVSFSVNGGFSWQPASAASGTVTTNLKTSPSGVAHTFMWNTFASGFFGQSDSVVLRIVAYASLKPAYNGVPGLYQRPYTSAITFPFRVLSTQVRVITSDMLTPATPRLSLGHDVFVPLLAKNAIFRPTIPVTSLANAVVYRLPAGQFQGAKPLTSGSGDPLHTDYRGYLQGRGEFKRGDRLMALLPVFTTDIYTLYYTNAAPTATGLALPIVITPGLQTLVVSANNPLLLFNLDVSLEWDARADPQFLSQLTYDLKRASEILYDWTNGQVALGSITIYQSKQHWNDAHIRIYATNRLRPNANQGGISSRLVSDPLKAAIAYAPGQLRIGAVWNRYGEPTSNLGEDWPRTLAHELGHYILYLDDNYIGLNEQGILVPVTTCTGTAMSDPYRDDYSEFHPAAGWLPDCAQTLSNQNTGRADWTTITSFYPWLNSPSGILSDLNTGPSVLPLDVTQVMFAPIPTPTNTLAAPIFLLSRQENRSSYQPGNSARAVLFKRIAGPDSPVMELGSV